MSNGNKFGCGGGDEKYAMYWLANNGGLTARDEYRYENKQGLCRADSLNKIV